MGDKITEHFSKHEFACKCGCGKDNVDRDLVLRLEDVHGYLRKCERGCKYIIITSGVRCPSHSVSVGGYENDAHTRGFAADWYAVDDKGALYPSEQLAAVAELYGFGGIGLVTDTVVHTDIRDIRDYANNHWYGDERTGANITTFSAHIPPAKIINKHKISVFYDGNAIFESEV